MLYRCTRGIQTFPIVSRRVKFQDRDHCGYPLSLQITDETLQKDVFNLSRPYGRGMLIRDQLWLKN